MKKQLFQIMDENDISTDIQNRHPTPFTDQTFNIVKRTAKSGKMSGVVNGNIFQSFYRN